jgi:predicted nucleotidyltransferase
MRPSLLLERYRSEILKIATKYKQKCLYNLRVFGSVARGEDTEDSDIDFIVDVNDDLMPSLLTLIGLNNELEDLFGIKVDVITARTIPDQFRERIFGEAVNL